MQHQRDHGGELRRDNLFGTNAQLYVQCYQVQVEQHNKRDKTQKHTKIGKQNDQRMKRLKEKIAETVNLPQFILNYVYHKKTTFKVYSKYMVDYDVHIYNGTYFQL